MDRFAAGTQTVADGHCRFVCLFCCGAAAIRALAAKQCGITEKVSYISTGGGAFLHMMEGKVLPGVAGIRIVYSL